MKLRPRLFLLAAPSAALALGAVLAGDPFWRGLLVGLALGPIPVVLVVGAATLFLRRRFLASRALEPPPLPTKSWDYHLDLRDLDGQPVQTTLWAGKVVVLNLWATWCTPCIAEMPALRRLLEQTAELDVQYAFISSEALDVVRSFVAKKGWDLPCYVLTGEPPDCFRGRAVPATYIIDRSGAIALRHFGAAAWDAANVVTFVRGLAATPPQSGGR